ncbi:DUF6223 family protein [Actinomadura coerulea]|uniref:DUF6223 family protein n=1 Tax=Actinomadura coerulea TaxID=46159 RepID=UPI003419E0D7
MSLANTLAAPLAGSLAAGSQVDGGYMTNARMFAMAAALVGLAGAAIGGLALARAARRVGNSGKNGAIVALVSGLIAVVGGVVNLAVADGGPGTGNGVVGGALAIGLGLIAIVLGAVARARSRKTGGRGAHHSMSSAS